MREKRLMPVRLNRGLPVTTTAYHKKGTLIKPLTAFGSITILIVGSVSGRAQHSCLINGPSQDFLTNGLMAYYPFNGNANDVSGNGNNGTVHGATLTADRFGNPNSAYAFSGSYISIPFAAGFDIPPGGQFTISAWANPSNTGHGTVALFVKDNWDYGLNLNSGNLFFVGDGAAASCTAHTIAAPGTWYHVVGTYSNGSWALYVNGTLEGTVYDGVRLITESSDYEAIGRKGSSGMDYFPGSLDDVRFYNRALSASEVAQVYAYESQHPYIAIATAVRLDFSYLLVGTNYQLIVSYDLNSWTNLGPPFTATSTTMSEYVDAQGQGAYFRLAH